MIDSGQADERRTRREERRAAMVRAAIDAVRRHGPGVSVADIAAQAGITKPVLYRHFDDRADLHRAVGHAAAELLTGRVAPQVGRERDDREQIRAVIDAFLAGIEAEPQLWRFVVHSHGERSAGAHTADDVRSATVRTLAAMMDERLRALRIDPGGAEVWAQGLVGMLQSAGDWWLERRTTSRAAMTDHLTALVWGGVSGVLRGADAGGRAAAGRPGR
jgi:AcrR family transcriptional regulator